MIMIIRTSLLYILGVSTLIGALLAQTQINVTEGSTAELSCMLPDVQDQPRIVWRYNNNTEVFERKGKESIVGDGYEGRVDVPEKKLRNGDCTLVLKGVNVNDAGEYESLVRSAGVMKLFQRVKLVVRADAGMKRPHPVIILLSVVMVTASRLLL